MSSSQVVAGLESSVERGLDDQQVALHRQRIGWNQLIEAAPPPMWKKVIAQFRELLFPETLSSWRQVIMCPPTRD